MNLEVKSIPCYEKRSRVFTRTKISCFRSNNINIINNIMDPNIEILFLKTKIK